MRGRTDRARLGAGMLTVGLLVSSLIGGCGGGTPGARGPGGESGGSSAGGETASGGPTAPDKGFDCSDGSCSECGDGMCPKGFYCLESAAKGPACSWLPTCGTSVGCACVKAALGSGCSCEERDHGVYASCK